MYEKPDNLDVDLKSTSTGIVWPWVIYGTVIGLIIVTGFFSISSVVYSKPAIPYLIGGLGALLTGMVLGHYSPGHTFREATVAGLLVPLVVFTLVYLDVIESGLKDNPWWTQVLLALGGMVMTQIGGWVGEELEGYDHPTRIIQWHWIVVACVIGFMLNSFVLFFVVPLVFKLVPIIVFLAISLFASGLIAGYKSPGHTEKECGLAGVVTVTLNFLFLKFGVGYSDELLPWTYLLVAIVAGAVLSLAGGYLGERFRAREDAMKKEVE